MVTEPARTMADVLARHQRRSTGMAAGSPDGCTCGADVYPESVDYSAPENWPKIKDIGTRRDEAFARHQADALAAAQNEAGPTSDPWPIPGSVAIATVRGGFKDVLLVRFAVSLHADRWFSPVGLGPKGEHEFLDHEVTVTSRAAVVTEADVEQLMGAICHGEQQHDEHVQYCVPIREWFAALLDGGEPT